MEKDGQLLWSGPGRPLLTLPLHVQSLKGAVPGWEPGAQKTGGELPPRHLWVTSTVLWWACLQHPTFCYDALGLGAPQAGSGPSGPTLSLMPTAKKA